MASTYAVLNASRGSGYKDRIEVRYHLPEKIRPSARHAVGGRIVYYEPRRAADGRGRSVYFACAKVTGMVPDDETGMPNHHFLKVTDFVPFRVPVSLRKADGSYWESQMSPGNAKAYTQNSIRYLAPSDFAAIVNAGLGDLFDEDKIALHDMDGIAADEDTSNLFRLPSWERERRIETILTSRPIRDAMFRTAVRKAYGYRCAITGLEIRNGGGRPEVEGAHIWSVERGGPDVVQNGIALSKTVHWMFDRGLVGIRDDYSLIVSHNKVPEAYRGLIKNQEARIILPKDETLRPDPFFLAKHREVHCL